MGKGAEGGRRHTCFQCKEKRKGENKKSGKDRLGGIVFDP